MRCIKVYKLVTSAAAAVGLFLPPSRVYAQGCAACYNDAAAQSAAGVRALQHGILALLFPAVIMFAGVFVVAYRRRNRFSSQNAEEIEEGARVKVAASEAAR